MCAIKHVEERTYCCTCSNGVHATLELNEIRSLIAPRDQANAASIFASGGYVAPSPNSLGY